MKNRTYTAREVIEILRRALDEESASDSRQQKERCTDCSSELSPSKKKGGKPYCVPCYIEWKESQGGRK